MPVQVYVAMGGGGGGGGGDTALCFIEDVLHAVVTILFPAL